MTVEEKPLTRGERTRQAILDAAQKLFLANGYNGTSMRQIARAARIALGGIYNHFEGKEDIFRALLEDRMPFPKVIQLLDSIDSGNGPGMLGEAFTRLQALAREYVDFFALALTDMREFEGRTIRILAARIMPQVISFTKRVEAAGGLREDVDTIILARLFISLMIGYMFTDLVAYSEEQPLLPGLPDGQEVRAGVQDILLYGVAVRESET